MEKKLFEELESGLKEAIQIAKGEKTPKTVHFVFSPEEIKGIRSRADMSQSEFARTFNISLDTVKGWEQGKRSPNGVATNFLQLIDANPEYVRDTLAASAQILNENPQRHHRTSDRRYGRVPPDKRRATPTSEKRKAG